MISSKGAGFAGILQSLTGLERVSTRGAFAKMAGVDGGYGANATGLNAEPPFDDFQEG
jgi:hypothetical protein